MPTLLIVLVGVTAVPALGALASAWWSRRRFARASGAFRCKLRVRYGGLPGLRRTWPRRASYACWVHDVLLVHRGVLVGRTVPILVCAPDGAMRSLPPRCVPGLGREQVLLAAELDDGPAVEIVAPESAHALLAGPYLAAAAMVAPRARTDRPG